MYRIRPYVLTVLIMIRVFRLTQTLSTDLTNSISNITQLESPGSEPSS